MIPLRLVVDTNIVVSAALKPDGVQRTVLILAITKPARLYIGEAIMSEYREVLARPKMDIRKGLQQQILQDVCLRLRINQASNLMEVGDPSLLGPNRMHDTPHFPDLS